MTTGKYFFETFSPNIHPPEPPPLKQGTEIVSAAAGLIDNAKINKEEKSGFMTDKIIQSITKDNPPKSRQWSDTHKNY